MSKINIKGRKENDKKVSCGSVCFYDMLGAFGACKNEPDIINVTVSPSDHPDHTDYRPVTVTRKGQGGAHATTTTLWFALSEGNFDNSTPKDVVYTISGDDPRENPVSLQKTKAVDYETYSDGTYWHVYFVGIDEKTPITANGYVSFDLSSEPEGEIPYEYHVRQCGLDRGKEVK
ncbi:hypothetical protein [Treponema endosymbiont of Eucomonympha sp.]|uniref:hypothetical protein n=1 Tax=Treponema endosymbiont of Eucomonympha sp. TaxID=1580831 RepID=UPI0007515F91|nr:hypothetical protein [Treponema endosymbiont of Eucomonympha sp.]